ncbi:MAG: uroporphyrinogen decarboxylase family protein [Halanaerobiales bacterium]
MSEANLLLSEGSPEEVKEVTKKCIDGAYANGGHIPGSSNSIIHTIPAENYLAMLETARTYGVYSR